MPEELQMAHDNQALSLVKTLSDAGVRPSMVVPNTGDHATAALQQLTDAHGDVPPMFTIALGKQLIGFNLSQLTQPTQGENPVLNNIVNVAGRLNGRPDIDAETWNGMPEPAKTKLIESAFNSLNTAPPTAENGASLLAQAQNQLATYTAQQSWQQKPEVVKQLQQKVAFYQKSVPTLIQAENQRKAAQAANDATARANAEAAVKKANADPSNWLPKVTADEKKKTELAENIASNANDVASIIQRRPDLVGAVSGRYTSAEQMIGNNDPDISALGTHIHNIAMANSGVHGFRSQEGVESYEKMLLNNFHNGPKAIAGALMASTSSVQTFIDNARPETYKTHSKQGGALRGMGRP